MTPRTTRFIRPQLALAFLAPAVLLSGCSDEAPAENEGPPAAPEGEVTGRVLGGTISDDMLPLEQLRSQSPSVKDAPNPERADRPSAQSESNDEQSGAGEPPDEAPGGSDTSEPEAETPQEPSAAPPAIAPPAAAASPAVPAPPPPVDGR